MPHKFNCVQGAAAANTTKFNKLRLRAAINILWFNKLIGRFKIAVAMKASALMRTSGSVAALFVLALQPAGVSAAPNDDGAIARQKAAIQAFDAAHKDYLKTGDLATFRSKLDQSAGELSAGFDEFNRAHNSTAAALSLLKLGEIYRCQENYRPAF